MLNRLTIAVVRRPMRSLLAGAGSLVGLALVGYSVVFAASAAGAVVGELDSLAATSVSVVAARADVGVRASDADMARLDGLPGTVAVGRVTTIGAGSIVVNPSPWSTEAYEAPVTGVDAGAVAYLDLEIEGRGFASAGYRFGFNEAIVGVGVADALDDPIAPGSEIAVDGHTFRVVGVAYDADQRPEVLFQVLVPRAAAARIWPTRTARSEIVIRTVPGAAGLVARHAGLVVSPERPDDVVALYEPEPEQFRTRLTGHLDSFTIGLAAALVALSVGITAATSASDVVGRSQEIGIRRALGATRRDIAVQFLTESGIVNLTAGAIGVSVGTAIGVVAALRQSWDPVIPLWTAVLGPLVGLVAGIAGSVLPARRAAATDPVVALRQL